MARISRFRGASGVIFVLRVIIFSFLILAGFYLSVCSITARKVVTVIYTLTLFWYTFGSRMTSFTGTPVYGSASSPANPAPSSFWNQVGRLIVSVFGSQPDGTLAGGGWFPALVFNALLFVPMGYLLLLWFRRLRKNTWLAVGICMVVSVGIELLQEWTGLGMADWKDVLANVLGGAVGVLIAKAFAVRSSSRD